MAKAKKSAGTITIEGAGAIKRFVVPVLPHGGVAEICGPQGAGKTTALAAIHAAVTGKGKVPIRDGEKAALVEAFGVNLRIGARVTRGGESAAVGLEGKFDVSDIVDPGIANAESADAKRIKALVQLTGVEADISAFEIEGDGPAVEWSPSTLEAKDLVSMAERVKRDLDAAARKEEDRAENCRGRVQALRGAIQAVDKRLPVDEVTATSAQKALEEAIAAKAKAEAEWAARHDRMEAVANARVSLARAKAEREGRTKEEAEEDLKYARKQLDRVQAEVVDLRKELAKAEEELKTRSHAVEIAEASRKATDAHFKLVAEWEATIADAAGVDGEGVSAAKLEKVAADVSGARQIVADVALRDQLEIQREEMEAQAVAASRAEKAAAQLRDAAKRTDEVLSDAVAGLGVNLFVEGGRLKTKTDRGDECFAELSDGERWMLALEIAIDQAAKLADDAHLGVMEIPQRAWGEFQPKTREWVRALCEERGVMAYTALATDDEALNVRT